MNHKIIQPEGAALKDLLRMQGADKFISESTPSSQKGALSTDEVRKIASHIEKVTKMKVSSALKSGEENLKPISLEDLKKLLDRNMDSRMEQFARYPGVVEQLRAETSKNSLAVDHMPAFFNAADDNVYLVTENFEKIWGRKCEEKCIEPGSAEGRRFRKFSELLYFTHEEIHKTTAQNTPILKDSASNRWREQAKVLIEHLEGERTPEAEVRAINALISINDKYGAIDTYIEGIAHYGGHKVMCRMGYSRWADMEIGIIRKSPAIADAPLEFMEAVNGVKFMEAIQVKTHENPIAFTIKHPPTSMGLIENPEEYLKARKEGKI